MRHFTFPILFLIVLTSSVFGQRSLKIGKISSQDFNVKYEHLDSQASAVVISDIGSSKIEWVDYKNWFNAVTTKHIRIKINDKSGLDYGNFTIRLYKSGTTREEIKNLKGVTANLEQGKVVLSKLTNKSIFEEEKNKNNTYLKISMPNVKEGSIIDLTYTIYSEFYYSLPDWIFQKMIPVLHSKYTIVYPEFFDYNIKVKGYENVKLSENSTQTKTEVYYSNPINIFTKTYESANVPAFSAEKYMTTARNFLSSLNIELRTISFPNTPVMNFSKSWEEIRKSLMNSEYFGQQLNKSGLVKDWIAQIETGATDREKIHQAYALVKSYFSWNGEKDVYISKSLKQVINKKEGNSADINMTLTLLLRELGIRANPLILSTRDHGAIYPTSPTITSFNYTISAVRHEKNWILLDATRKDLQPGILPRECFNGKGRLISENFTDWVDISPLMSYKTKNVMNVHINDGKLQVECTESHQGYALLDYKRKISEYPSHEEYFESISNSDEEILDYKITDNENGSVSEKTKISCTKYLDQVDDFIIVEPFLKAATKSNPFKQDSRNYPVDFAVPIEEDLYTKITLPEGYEVEELPEETVVDLLERSGSFVYNIKRIQENVILVSSRLKINRTIYLPTEYKVLKEFFSIVVSKHAEPIVIQKIQQ